MATKINDCVKTNSPAALQIRHELAKVMLAARTPIETDEMNENDVRVAASVGDRCTPWVRAKDAETAIANWNAANPDPAELAKLSQEDLLAHAQKLQAAAS